MKNPKWLQELQAESQALDREEEELHRETRARLERASALLNRVRVTLTAGI